jgi:hypothetical protein
VVAHVQERNFDGVLDSGPTTLSFGLGSGIFGEIQEDNGANGKWGSNINQGAVV